MKRIELCQRFRIIIMTQQKLEDLKKNPCKYIIHTTVYRQGKKYWKHPEKFLSIRQFPRPNMLISLFKIGTMH